MEVKHTYLFTEGTWESKGYLFDAEEKSMAAEGRMIIKHNEETWLVSNLIKAAGDNSVEINNEYEVTPLKENGKAALWKCKSPLLGKLKGSFLIHGEYIISLFESEDKKYSGSEYLILVNENRYRYRGVIFIEENKFVSWTLEVKKVINK